MGVELNAVTLLVAPFIFLVGVVKVEVAGHLFTKPESSGTFSCALYPVEFGLDDVILGAPGIGEIDKLEID